MLWTPAIEFASWIRIPAIFLPFVGEGETLLSPLLLCAFNLENCFKSYIFSLSFALSKVSEKPETIALLGFRPGFPPAKPTRVQGQIFWKRWTIHPYFSESLFSSVFTLCPLEQKYFAKIVLQFYWQGLENWTFFVII